MLERRGKRFRRTGRSRIPESCSCRTTPRIGSPTKKNENDCANIANNIEVCFDFVNFFVLSSLQREVYFRNISVCSFSLYCTNLVLKRSCLKNHLRTLMRIRHNLRSFLKELLHFSLIIINLVVIFLRAQIIFKWCRGVKSRNLLKINWLCIFGGN